MTSRPARLALAAVVALAATACSDVTPSQVDTTVAEGRFDNPGKGPKAVSGNIIEVAQAASDADNGVTFETLIFALEATGLDAIFERRGQYTVFAPTDAAFGALPDGTVDFLVANPDVLAGILQYHVATGRRDAGDVLDSDRIRSLNGESFFPGLDADGPFLIDGQGGRSNIILTDVVASNGIIHVIDAVILP